MYKVFIENRAVIFTQNTESSQNTDLKKKQKKRSFDKYLLPLVLSHSEGEEVSVICEDVEKEMNVFFQHHDFIEAAGGIVKRKKRFLFIKRNGLWDIPKGKVEKDEEIEDAAVREVEEECGIKQVKLKSPLTVTYHTYDYKGRQVLKKTYWYVLTYKGNKRTIPQTEEGITKVKWLKINKFDKVRKSTYPSIIDVLYEFEEYLDR